MQPPAAVCQHGFAPMSPRAALRICGLQDHHTGGRASNISVWKS